MLNAPGFRMGGIMVIITLEQVSILLIFAVIGYILCKKKLANSGHAKLLSTLEVYVFLPCKVFQTFSTKFTVNYIREKYYFIMLSAVILLIVCVAAHFLAKLFSKKPYEHGVYTYSLVVPNYGYVGYALAEGLFGSEMLLNMMIFALPVMLYTYTIGFSMLTNRKFTWKKLLQPNVIAIALGCVVGLTGIKIPGVAEAVITKSAACMAPVSMILAGMTISEFQLKVLLMNVKYYAMTLLRLIVIPCALAFAVRQLVGPQEALLTILLYAMPCGMNTIVFPKLVGENCEIGAGLAFISSILACITIPICVGLFA